MWRANDGHKLRELNMVCGNRLDYSLSLDPSESAEILFRNQSSLISLRTFYLDDCAASAKKRLQVLLSRFGLFVPLMSKPTEASCAGDALRSISVIVPRGESWTW
jgi:hypothetical protein